MRKEDIKVGMKVVPFRKSNNCSFEKFKSECKDLFLIVNEIREDGSITILDSCNGEWYFMPEDLNPYIEPNQEIESLKQQLKERDERIKAIESENKKLEQSISDLGIEDARLENNHKTARSVISNLNQENQQRQARIDKLESKLTF